MPERRLNESASVTLGFFGSGTVSLGPKFYGERWQITSIALSTSTYALVPTARVYIGPRTPGNQLTATYDGSGDADTAINESLEAGQMLTVTWGPVDNQNDAPGDPGARATVSVFGKHIWGEP